MKWQGVTIRILSGRLRFYLRSTQPAFWPAALLTPSIEIPKGGATNRSETQKKMPPVETSHIFFWKGRLKSIIPRTMLFSKIETMSNQRLDFSDRFAISHVRRQLDSKKLKISSPTNSLWFLRTFVCTVSASATLTGPIDNLCLPSFTTSSASPPYDFVGIWSKRLWGTFVFEKIPFFSNSRKFCDKIIVRSGYFARTYRTTSPQERPCADHRLPLMAFFTEPPCFIAGMVCHLIRGQCLIFLRMPLHRNMRTQCS